MTDKDELWLSVKIVGIKLRSRLRILIGLLGLALVVLGAYNLIGVRIVGEPMLAGYRSVTKTVVVGGEQGLAYLSDIVLIAIGAIVVWVS